MFSAYMQEVTLKNVIIFNLFYLHSCFGPHVCIGNSRLKFLEMRLGVVVSERSSYYTHIILPPNSTNSFSRHNTRSSHTTLWLCLRHGTRQTNLCWVLFVYTNLRHCFQDIIHKDELRISIWNFYIPVKYIINCHIICVHSLVTWFVNFDAKTFVFLGYLLSENNPSFE